ncbi:Uncharacterized protein DBV15_10508 [Temnothorax longispinosus]|uniref:Uncharacterized protein n=1 Tax=Temnothorax longispinosus TaxID=300112 RepID=A0A4V3SBF1_9HYME|nr:Uncharacterized protein DBV15_10508 [Temnothorax longispinosus]
MRTAWILSLVVSPLLVLGSPPGSTIREGGIKIGTGRGTVPKSVNVGRGNSAVRIGEGSRLSNSTRQRSFPTTTTTTTTTTPTRFTPQSSVNNSGNNINITKLTVGMLVPYKSFGVREYTRAASSAISVLQRSTKGPRLGLFQRYDLRVKIAMQELTPSPTDSIGVGESSLKLIDFMKNRSRVEIGCFHAAALRRKKARRRAQFCHVNHVGKAGRQPGAAHTSLRAAPPITAHRVQSSPHASPHLNEYIGREMVVLLPEILKEQTNGKTNGKDAES